jgi:hypothetical protein
LTWAAPPSGEHDALAQDHVDLEDDINAHTDGAINTHDANIDGDLSAHDANIDGDLSTHDTDIKNLLNAAPPGPSEITTCGQTLSSPGSYILLDHLGPCSDDGIVIDSDFVTVDLNGFVLSGDGSGDGIGTTSPGNKLGLVVRNGTIDTFNFGVRLYGNGSLVEDLVVVNSQDDGIAVGGGATIRNNVVIEGHADGITTSTGPTIIGNTVRQNLGTGIFPQEGATVVNNTVSQNGGDGIFAQKGVALIGNNAWDNGNEGIEVTCPANLIGNTAINNGGTNLLLNTGTYDEPCNDVDNLGSTLTPSLP